MSNGVFQLDSNETFPRLARAPIVEAVIHWQARAPMPLEREALQQALTARLGKYPQSSPIREFGLMAEFSAQAATRVEHQNGQFMGMRLTSDDGAYVMQFRRDGLVFSRTKSYEHWDSFAAAARDAWQAFVDIAAPVDIQRLGVRFINHIASATPESLPDFLREPPTCPSNLPLKEFVYQSTFAVPGYPFGVRVIKVMQPPMPELRQSSGLFLDVDVYTASAIPNDSAVLDEKLGLMRKLKNRVFFSLVTEQAIQSFTKG